MLKERIAKKEDEEKIGWIKRFMEQWIIWIAVDVVSVIMWVVALSTEEGSIAMVLMWSVYLANAIIMFVKWLKESKQQTEGVAKE